MNTVEKLDHLDSILATYDEKTGTVQVNGRRVIFHMGTWIIADSHDDFEDFLEDVEDRGATITDFCDTACCAFGAAALNPTFNKMGLYVDPDDLEIYYKDEPCLDSGAEFFGISEIEAEYLFVGGYDKPLSEVTIEDVRARIAEVRAYHD